MEIDNYKAAYDAATSLIRGGHKRIAMVNCAIPINSSILREKGFHQAPQDAGITPEEELIVHGMFGVPDGSEACEKLLALP